MSVEATGLSVSISMLALIFGSIAAVVGTIFTLTFARTALGSWHRKDELDSINHAHSVAALTEISTQANQGANILPEAGAFEQTKKNGAQA